MEDEIWKDIYFEENGIVYNYIGLYKISNKGRVESLGASEGHNSKKRILKGWKSQKGYLQVEFRNKENKRKTFAVHRLVAHMFLSEEYFDGAEVNHKDENKENNNVNNLEWCTTEYNCNYGTRNKRHGETIKNENHYASIPVAQYDTQMNLIKIWSCSSEVERELGIWASNIRKCCNGERKTSGGFKWKYIGDDNNELL